MQNRSVKKAELSSHSKGKNFEKDTEKLATISSFVAFNLTLYYALYIKIKFIALILFFLINKSECVSVCMFKINSLTP
jgi:hypothetical protein